MRRVATVLDRDLVMAVLDRDGYRCVRCGVPVGAGQRGWDWSVHHRLPRGMGGTSRVYTAAGLLTLCGSGARGCHGHVESHRAEALACGWLVSRYADPAAVAVLVEHGSRWTYLTHGGGMSDNPPGGE